MDLKAVRAVLRDEAFLRRALLDADVAAREDIGQIGERISLREGADEPMASSARVALVLADPERQRAIAMADAIAAALVRRFPAVEVQSRTQRLAGAVDNTGGTTGGAPARPASEVDLEASVEELERQYRLLQSQAEARRALLGSESVQRQRLQDAQAQLSVLEDEIGLLQAQLQLLGPDVVVESTAHSDTRSTVAEASAATDGGEPGSRPESIGVGSLRSALAEDSAVEDPVPTVLQEARGELRRRQSAYATLVDEAGPRSLFSRQHVDRVRTEMAIAAARVSALERLRAPHLQTQRPDTAAAEVARPAPPATSTVKPDVAVVKPTVTVAERLHELQRRRERVLRRIDEYGVQIQTATRTSEQLKRLTRLLETRRAQRAKAQENGKQGAGNGDQPEPADALARPPEPALMIEVMRSAWTPDDETVAGMSRAGLLGLLLVLLSTCVVIPSMAGLLSATARGRATKPET
ncbi:MAG: hypothetical protein KDK91_32390, partial [Gammaproteobacteria bacterium]|nr:hypothetical protein [Gammaproteobacteria bacterium]